MPALVGAVSKVILHVSTTAANVHDSRALAWMLNEEEDAGRTLFADSAYSGKNLEELTRSFNVNPCFCEKGYANTPLTELQQKLNHLKSKIRYRIEHVFGYIETVFKGSFVGSIGLRRATFHSWLTALAYNVFFSPTSALPQYLLVAARPGRPRSFYRISLIIDSTRSFQALQRGGL